jgi:RHS repeat-associated protein
VSDSLGGLLTLSYDARDELTGEQFSGTGLSAEAVTYSYDNAGRMTGITRYSNLAETTEVAATAYSYDHDNRMTGIVDSNSTGTTLVSYGYTYDAADRVTQEVRTWDSSADADTLTYSYTNNNQLTSVSHTNNSFSNESFTWDNNGNETGTGYTTGTDNEQTASPGYTYTYDNAGEMTSETQTSTGDVWTYGYDLGGRMVTAVEKTSGGTTLESVTYMYDALDNRIGMDENSTQTWTLYDSGKPIMDFNSSGSLTMRYLWGPTGIVARQTSGGTVSWYLADHLGTVRDLINNSGAIIDHVDFSAFGTVLDESSPTNGDRMMGFAMLQRDSVTGLNLAVYREENPRTGRWNTQDPLAFAAEDDDLYRYVRNDASSSRDASGAGPDSVSGSFWAAILRGDYQAALAILETSTSVGFNIANNVRTGMTAVGALIGKIIADLPAKSGQCAQAAQRIADVFRAAGQSPVIVEFRNRLGGLYFTLPDGTRFATQGWHQVVMVGGRVYDALTGPAGMPVQEYVKFLIKLGIIPQVVPVSH